ncbi:MAG TPA: GDP-mannose 4,6 dehydratase, partial [Rhodospirillaceae bacterium]|nr:GDP-mannose 4,6 dehydratase [Rhodospirillaceae bacterium]
DWGYAPDYIDAIYRMVQGDEPKDFVIATGVGRTVRDLLEVAFGTVGINWQDHVVIEPKFYREIEAVPLIGDARAIELELGWNATKPFSEIIEEMVVSDLQLLQKA